MFNKKSTNETTWINTSNRLAERNLQYCTIYTVELTYVVARSTNRKCSKKVRSVEEKGGRASCK